MEPLASASTKETQRYGRYEVLFRIAAGGMAEVYVARMVGEGGFEKLVALKRMLPTLAEDERFVGMFLDEGRVAANISSPHVVSTLDLGRAEDDSLYLVMELVVGVSLSALVKVAAKAGETIPLDLAVELLAQAALGLEDAHEARTIYGEPLGIVHRDISPQNVLIDVAGRVRITDFGVARALERVTQTQSGEVKGKLAYFAPEQARAKPLDRRADVYSLGIVGWELLTGRRLFLGDGPADTLTKVLEMPAPPITEFRPDAPPALGAVIARALNRDLALRTPTAGQFAVELRAAMPTAGAPALGRFVRARGGESLLRLEEGIRALVPSSASGRVHGAGSGAARPPAILPPGEDLTTRTPSVSAVLERRPEEWTGPLPEPVLPPQAAAAPLPATSPVEMAKGPPSRGSMMALIAGAVLLVAGAVAGTVLVMSGTSSPVPAADTAPIGTAPAAVAPTEPPVVPTGALPPTAAAEEAGEMVAPELAGETTEPVPTEDPVADASLDGSRGRGRRTRATHAEATTAAAAGTPTATASSTATPTETGRTTREERESSGSTGGLGSRSGAGLRGMDDFDSELGGN